MQFLYKGQYLYNSVFIVQVMLMIDASFRVFGFETSQILSLVRYGLYFLGVYWMFKGIVKNHVKIPFLYAIFLLWVTYLLLSALPELTNPFHNYSTFKQFISGVLFIYSLPFLICVDLSTSFFKSIFKLSSYMIVAYIVLSIPIYLSDSTFQTRGLSEYITFLVEGAIIMLMIFSYQRKKTNLINVIAVVIAIIIMMLFARRNKVVFYGGGLGLAIIINVLNGYVSIKKKIAIISAVCIGFVFLLFSGNMFDAFFNKMETGMSSRELVIEDFIDDFNRTPSDWVFGRGLFGEFDGGFLNNNEETGLRGGIENGYLQLILKGGWIWLGLLILISINAIYKGLFRSNNIFVKGCACIILLYFLDMIGFGIPEASLKYIMVFLSISVCTSPRWRSYTDKELKQQLAI